MLLPDRRSSFISEAARPWVAIAAIFPAAMVPIALPALQTAVLSDVVRGGVASVLLSTSQLLLALAFKPTPRLTVA